MDLRKDYPRSVREPFAGVLMLGRTTDKAKAQAAGTAGEYNYNCPMDKAVFEFLGINADDYLEKVKSSPTEIEVEEYAREFTANKSQADIDAFNERMLAHAPKPGSEAEDYFVELRGKLAPDRTDVTTWADLLDLEEKRQVPHRVPV